MNGDVYPHSFDEYRRLEVVEVNGRMQMVFGDAPVFQKSNVGFYTYEHQYLMSLKHEPPENTVEDYYEYLDEIYNTFQFNTFEDYDRLSIGVTYTLGKCMTRRSFRENMPELEHLEAEYNAFVELLESHIDMVDSDKPSIRVPNYDKTSADYQSTQYRRSRDRARYGRINRREEIYESVKVLEQAELIKQQIVQANAEKQLKITEAQQRQQQTILEMARMTKIVDGNLVVKPKREYDLDTMDICDEVYGEVIEYMESRKDFIYVDYNNMKEIY